MQEEAVALSNALALATQVIDEVGGLASDGDMGGLESVLLVA